MSFLSTAPASPEIGEFISEAFDKWRRDVDIPSPVAARIGGANTHHRVRLSLSPRSAERDGLATTAQMQRLRSIFGRVAKIRRLYPELASL